MLSLEVDWDSARLPGWLLATEDSALELEAPPSPAATTPTGAVACALELELALASLFEATPALWAVTSALDVDALVLVLDLAGTPAKLPATSEAVDPWELVLVFEEELPVLLDRLASAEFDDVDDVALAVLEVADEEGAVEEEVDTGSGGMVYGASPRTVPILLISDPETLLRRQDSPRQQGLRARVVPG